MKDLTFAHITDTHFCCEGSSDFVKTINKSYNPLEKLHNVLKNMPKPDFFLLTGDLVHDGNAEDYKNYRAVFEQHFPGVPLYCALGNHDYADEFRVGFLDEQPQGKPYYDVFYHDDLRIITLDTGYNLHGDEGDLSQEQWDFLEKTLSESYGRGTIVITHHPFVCETERYQIRKDRDTAEIIEKSDILAFINGHAHSSMTAMYHGKLHVTGESMAFAIEPDYHNAQRHYTDKLGWAKWTLKGKNIACKQFIVSPVSTISQTKSM